jgi:hypothetical protein
MIWEGELIIGHGQFIARVNDAGGLTEKAWTAPTGWYIVDFDIVGNELAVLCSPKSLNTGRSAIFYWDGIATTGYTDFSYISTGDPQMIVNHGETVRVFCVFRRLSTSINGTLRIYEMIDKKPFLTHKLENIFVSYKSFGLTGYYNYAVPPRSKAIINNTLYFTVSRTAYERFPASLPINIDDLGGVYALGRVSDNPFGDGKVALSRSRSLSQGTSGTPLRLILAQYVVSDDFQVSHIDSGVYEETPYRIDVSTYDRSSAASYESIWIDGGNPETHKRWDELYIVKSYAGSVTAYGMQDDGVETLIGTFGSSATFCKSTFNINSKAIKIRLSMSSSAKIYSVSVRSVSESIKQASQ